MILNRTLWVAILSGVLALFQPPVDAAPVAADPAAALATLARQYHDAQARLDPGYTATLAGDNRFDDQPPLSVLDAHVERWIASRR